MLCKPTCAIWSPAKRFRIFDQVFPVLFGVVFVVQGPRRLFCFVGLRSSIIRLELPLAERALAIHNIKGVRIHFEQIPTCTVLC